MPKKGSHGKKVFHSKLVILDREDTISSKASPHIVIEKLNTTRRSMNMKENRSSTGKVQEIFISELKPGYRESRTEAKKRLLLCYFPGMK